MTDFAVRRFLVFHDLLPFFIPKRNTFGIIMFMRQILLTIMHVGSIMPYVISGAVRKPGYVLTIIWFYNPPSVHTKARIYVFPIGWHSSSFIRETWAEVNFTGSVRSSWRFRWIWKYDIVKIGIHFMLSIYLNTVYTLSFNAYIVYPCCNITTRMHRFSSIET